MDESITTFPVRLATHAEVRALVALVNSAYRGESSRAGWTTEADLLGGQRVDEAGIVEMLDRPDNAILVYALVPASSPTACVHLARTGSDAYLGMLTVQPTQQRGGIGRQLLEAAERWALKHWGSRVIHMTVIAQRPELIAWYERRGYRRADTRKAFPYGDARFGLPKRNDLVFEVLHKPLAP